MRHRLIIGVFLAVVFISLIIIGVVGKHSISYDACYCIPTERTEFYPDAYRVVNSEQEARNLFELIDKELNADSLISKNRLDFARYTYLLVFGARIKRLYYSKKSTWFDDKSPSYAGARRKNKNCVFVEYDIPDHRIWLYRLNWDTTLTGFDGI